MTSSAALVCCRSLPLLLLMLAFSPGAAAVKTGEISTLKLPSVDLFCINERCEQNFVDLFTASFLVILNSCLASMYSTPTHDSLRNACTIQ
ncbi:uncharacterized protein V6R79_014554 [Siganus canaliculatus]